VTPSARLRVVLFWLLVAVRAGRVTALICAVRKIQQASGKVDDLGKRQDFTFQVRYVARKAYKSVIGYNWTWQGSAT